MAKAGTNATEDCIFLAVDESYRVTIPQQFAKKTGWITGDQAIDAWLLVGSRDRVKLLSQAEVDTDAHVRDLRNRIAEASLPNESLIEFQEESLAVLPMRILRTEIRRRGRGRRLTLPMEVAVMMQVQPAGSKIAALFLSNHIEFWTVEAYSAACSKPLTQII
jgi:hypothetical protein